MLIQRRDRGLKILRQIQILGKDSEVYRTKKNALETTTHKFRGKDPRDFEPSMWELWFEYPSQSGELPVGVSEGAIITVCGYLVMEGNMHDPALHGRIHVTEFYTTTAEFMEFAPMYMAEAACLFRQINDILYKDKPYTPGKPGPWDQTKPQVPEAPKALMPAPPPAPTPAPMTGDNEGPVSDMVLEPKPGEKVDTSFDPAKLSTPTAPVAPQGWGKGSGAWSMPNGQRSQTAG